MPKHLNPTSSDELIRNHSQASILSTGPSKRCPLVIGMDPLTGNPIQSKPLTAGIIVEKMARSR